MAALDLWGLADLLRHESYKMQRDAQALERTAIKMQVLASALADGRIEEVVEIAISLGRP